MNYKEKIAQMNTLTITEKKELIAIFDEMGGGSPELQEQVEAQGKTITAMQQTIATLTQTVSTLSEQVKQNTADIEALKSQPQA